MSTDFLTIANPLIAEFEKIKYLDRVSVMPFANQAPVFSMISKVQNETSRSPKWKLELGTIDGISFGNPSLESPTDEGDEASVDMKKMFQHLRFDRFSDQVMRGDKAGVYKLITKAIDKAALERALTIEHAIINGTSTGELAAIDTAGVVDNGGGSYTLTISTATYAIGLFRRRQMVQFASSSDLFDITEHSDINRTITVLRRSGGSHVPVAGQLIYRQGGKDNYPVGLKEIIQGTGNLFGVPRKFGWQSLKSDWSNKIISEQNLLELFMATKQRSLEYPDLLILSNVQFLKLQQVLRQGMMFTRDVSVKNTMRDGSSESFSVPNINHISLAGNEVKIIAHDMLPQGTGIFLSTKDLELRSTGPGDWVSIVGDSGGKLEYMANKTGADEYRMTWAYYWCLVCYKPESMSSFYSASSDSSLNIVR